MSEWMPKTLGELLGEKGYIRGPFGSSLKRGEMKENGIPVYEQLHAIYNTREFRFYIDEKKFKELERFQVKTADLIISCSGTVGKISIIEDDDPKGIISQALLILRPEIKNVRPVYLKYFLTSELGQYHLLSASHGSVQPNIAERKIVQQIPIDLPAVDEQDKIIEVLSSLDDKINLLHRNNKTLEQLAETLFRQWFVEEAEESWEIGVLNDISKFSNGKSRPEKEGAIPIYGGNGILGYADKNNYDGESIIIGRVGAYCGSLFYEDEPIWLSDNALLIKPLNPKNTFYLFYLLKSMDLNSMAEGSSHPLLTQSLLRSIEVIIPPEEKSEHFGYLVCEWYKKINACLINMKAISVVFFFLSQHIQFLILYPHHPTHQLWQEGITEGF